MDNAENKNTQETRLSPQDETKEWIEAITIGFIAGPFLFHFLSFTVEWYAPWIELIAVALFWRAIVHKRTFHVSKNTREWIEVIAIAGLLAINIRTFIVQPYKIPSSSMVPTLQIKDHLFVTRFNYWFKMPERGDIVVFQYPGDFKQPFWKKRDFIKRAIAFEGETVTIRFKDFEEEGDKIRKNVEVSINGDTVLQPYAYYYDAGSCKPGDNFGPFRVPEGHIFVMGDNRDFSLDARYWDKNEWNIKANDENVPLTHCVSRKKLKGRAVIIYWPFKRFKLLK